MRQPAAFSRSRGFDRINEAGFGQPGAGPMLWKLATVRRDTTRQHQFRVSGAVLTSTMEASYAA